MYLYFFPLIGAFMGWIFNLFFINYLFRKVIPAKAPAMAAAAGRYVSGQVLQTDKLAAKMAGPEQIAALRPIIDVHIDVFLKEKLKEKMPAIAMFIGEKTIDMMKKSLMEEIDLLLPELLTSYISGLGAKLDMEKILVNKVREIPEEKLNTLLLQHSKRERQAFLLFGAVTGFVIGTVLLLLALAGR